jgi:hypothetical protein
MTNARTKSAAQSPAEQERVLVTLEDLRARIVAVLYGPIDVGHLERVAWFHRPYTPEELAAHPERERIVATINAALEHRRVQVHAELGEPGP